MHVKIITFEINFLRKFLIGIETNVEIGKPEIVIYISSKRERNDGDRKSN